MVHWVYVAIILLVGVLIIDLIGLRFDYKITLKGYLTILIIILLIFIFSY
jgi:hypothetical protein